MGRKNIIIGDKVLMLFNKAKSRLLDQNNKVKHLSDEKTLELVLKEYLGGKHGSN